MCERSSENLNSLSTDSEKNVEKPFTIFQVELDKSLLNLPFTSEESTSGVRYDEDLFIIRIMRWKN